MAKTGGKVEQYRPGEAVTHTTSAAVTAGRIVRETADRTIAHAGTDALDAIGWAMETSDAAGDTMGVLLLGSGAVVPCVALGAIAAGQRVKCGADGRVVPVAADGDPRLIIGYTLAAIADAAEGLVVLTR